MILGDPREVSAEAEFGAATSVGVGGRLGGDRRDHATTGFFDDVEEELTLRREVLVQDGLGDAGGLGDLVHGGVVVAVSGEHRERNRQQLLASFRGGESHGHVGRVSR